MTGCVFDIKEFTVHDGPGSRLTVFLKGCPLRCKWCHNPEGLLPTPQLMKKTAQCVGCGQCQVPCSHPECSRYGVCLHACPRGLLSESGKLWEAEDLAAHLNSYQGLVDGGVTFSGGEPLLQGDFVAAVAKKLTLHKALQTSGYATQEMFSKVLAHMDYVLFDIKLADPEAHRHYTGVDNQPILNNYRLLLESGKPHVVRVPLIPGVTDGEENLRAIGRLTVDSKVELMQYNPLAGAKYPMVGKEYSFTPGEKNPVDLNWFSSATFV